MVAFHYARFYKSAILGMNVTAAAALNRKIVRLYNQNPDFDYHGPGTLSTLLHNQNSTYKA
jgi:hypothetical protein